MINKLWGSLTSNYRKKKQNTYKLFQVVGEEINEVKEALEKIQDWRDIDKAKGIPLEHLGSIVQQFRGKANDGIYRILIKSKIARNMSDGDINSIIEVIANALNTDFENITIEELYNDEDEPEPASIKVIKVPLETLNEVGMSGKQFAKIIERTTAGGVGVKTIELEGTFKFAKSDIIEDEEKGFADIEQTKGGTLGILYSPEDEEDLPL